jgi:hypothetical protein
MADPRRVSTRRAVLSYDQLKQLTKEAGFQWPDLLVKDYQGIIQDFIFTAEEIDDLELRVLENEIDIADLQSRVAVLEYKAFKTVITTDSLTTAGYQVIICKNTIPIVITLELSPQDETEVHIKRRGEEVTIIGTINGLVDRVINIPQWSDHLIYDGTDWSVI